MDGLSRVTGDRISSRVKADGWRTFDVERLPVEVRHVETAYRRLRAEWMSVKSSVRQIEAEVLEAKRSGDQAWIDEVGVRFAAAQTRAGTLKRLARLVGARAYAELYRSVAREVLPRELAQALDQAVADLMGAEHEIGDKSGAKGSAALAEEAVFLRELDAVIAAWGPKNAS